MLPSDRGQPCLRQLLLPTDTLMVLLHAQHACIRECHLTRSARSAAPPLCRRRSRGNAPAAQAQCTASCAVTCAPVPATSDEGLGSDLHGAPASPWLAWRVTQLPRAPPIAVPSAPSHRHKSQGRAAELQQPMANVSSVVASAPQRVSARHSVPRPVRRTAVAVHATKTDYRSPSSRTASTELERLEALSTVRQGSGACCKRLGPGARHARPTRVTCAAAARRPDPRHRRWCQMCCCRRACRRWRSPRRPPPRARCWQASWAPPPPCAASRCGGGGSCRQADLAASLHGTCRLHAALLTWGRVSHLNTQRGCLPFALHCAVCH